MEDNARIARMEARLDGHEALCGERWRELRRALDESRVASGEQHGENSARLRAIEDALTSARGGWRVIAAAGAAGAAIATAAAKFIPWASLIR